MLAQQQKIIIKTAIMLILMAITRMMIFVFWDKYNDDNHVGDNNEAKTSYYATK